MKSKKRILCLLLVLCLCCGLLAGCSRSDGRLEADLHIYNSVDVDTKMDEHADNLGESTILGDRLYTIAYEYDEEYNETVFLLSTKLDGTDLQKVPLSLHECDPETGWAYIQALLAGRDGALYAVESVSSSSGEGADWVYKEQYFISRIAEDGSMENSIELGLPEGTWPDTYATLCLDDGFLVPVDGNLLYVSFNGQSRTIEVLADGSGYINRLFRQADGTIVVYYYGGENWTAHFAPLDLTTGKLGEELSLPDATISGSLICDADGNMYSYDMTGIYALDLNAGTSELLCSWLDSDIDYNTISYLQPQTDGSFLAVSRGDNWDKLILSTLTYVDPTTLPEKTVLTLACTYSWEMQRAALAFNRTSDTTRVTLVDYSKYNTEENEWTGATTQLNTDIITGKIPDLLLVDSSLPFQNYVSKGLFTDLYPLLDADPDIAREDLVQSVLKACEADGRLTSIIPSYGIITLAGPTAAVGEKSGWTWDEFHAVLEKHPDAVPAMSYMDRQSLLTLALVMGGKDYIDYSTGTCHFDSDAFIKVLEYAATYPEEFNYDDMTLPEKDLFAQGKLLLSQVWVSDFSSLREYVYNMNGPITFKGFPTSDGTGGSAISPNLQLAISEACPAKEAAWEFLSYFLSEEYQSSMDMWMLPVRTDVLQAKAEEAMKPSANSGFVVDMPVADSLASSTLNIITDESTEEPTEEAVEEPTEDTVTAEDAETSVADDGIADDDIAEVLPEEGWGSEDDYWSRPLTQEEVDQIMTLINSTSTLYQWEQGLLDIIFEEANAFFAGTRTAQEAASILQNRAQTYISESR